MQLGSMFICNCNIAPEDGRKKRPKYVERYCSYK